MNRARPSLQKREREKAKREKQQQKLARRAEIKARKPEATPDGVDPDIAGIVPGPQPRPWDDDETGPSGS